MNILIAFSPFLVFVVLERLVGLEAGLLAAAMVSALVLGKDLLIARKSPKILEIGTMVLFGGLAIYVGIAAPIWSIVEVRLAVDAGLLLIVLVSMVIGQPFTLQYAREQVPSQYWNQPKFFRTNLVITSVWAAAFGVMVVADLAWLLIPGLSPRVVIVLTVLALLGAVKFTGWYPDRQRAV